MPPPRFYCAIDLAPNTQVKLPEDAAHHAMKVLRLTSGDAVTLFNGGGGEFEARIRFSGRDAVLVDLGRHLAVERESPLRLCLAQSLSSAERMDFTLQKAVELGVEAIQPIVSERSIVRLAGERAERRARHWRNVVIAACEQCGRNRVPVVSDTLKLDDWLGQAHGEALKLMLSPLGSATLDALAPPAQRVILLAGPEGGLTEAEHARVASRGFVPVRLGARVLRTETAAMAALSAMQALWGDFRESD